MSKIDPDASDSEPPALIELPVVGFGARVAPLATPIAVAPKELPWDRTVVPLLRNVPPV